MTHPGADGRASERAALIAGLELTPDRIAAVLGTRVATVTRSRSAGWTHRQVIGHLIAVERTVWHARLAQVAREVDPHWSWAEPGGEPGHRSTRELVASFRSARRGTIATLRGLDEAGWARSGTHATFGVLDVAGLMREALAHGADHLTALERQA